MYIPDSEALLSDRSAGGQLPGAVQYSPEVALAANDPLLDRLPATVVTNSNKNKPTHKI